jgi:hypothetical protein
MRKEVGGAVWWWLRSRAREFLAQTNTPARESLMERLVDSQAIRCDSLQLQVGQRESTKSAIAGIRSSQESQPVCTKRVHGFWPNSVLLEGIPTEAETFCYGSLRRLTELRIARDPEADYLAGREPVMRMSTSLLALCCQSGLVATLATPISARSRSIGSRSLRMSPLFIARFTSARSASWIRA